MRFGTDSPICLVKSIDSNRWPSKIELSSLSYKDWNTIIFMETFNFDYSPDTSELLKDTSLAPPQSEWFHSYDHCAFKILYNQNKPFLIDPEETRTLLRYLKGHPDELKDEINKIEQGHPSSRDNIMVLCRKERELKSDGGRLFVKQTHVRRLIQTSCEKNIEAIFKYIPHQTMTDSELALGKKNMQTLLNYQLFRISKS